MDIKDYLVFSFIFSLIFFGIFHQLASRIILKSIDLKEKLYGYKIYENEKLDIVNIQAIMSVITVINIQYFLYARKNPQYIFFKKRKHPLFPALDTGAAIYIVRNYKKLNYYILFQGFFGLFFLLIGIIFILLN